MGMSEDDISDAYEDYLEKETSAGLVSKLLLLMKKGTLCGYEKTHIISMIQNIDYSGEHDTGFEDERKKLINNKHLG